MTVGLNRLSLTRNTGGGVPGALTDVSVVGGNGGATLNFTTPASPSIAKVAVYRNQTGVFNSAHKVQEYAAVPSTVYNPLDGAAIANLFTTPDFSATGAWLLVNCTIGSGVANKAAGSAMSLRQAIATSVAQVVRFGWNQVTRTAGNFYAYLDATADQLGSAVTTTGIKFARLTVGTTGTHLGYFADTAAAGTIDDAVVFIETGACIPQGVTYYWFEAQNAQGIPGPPSGPYAVNVF